jgi:hypothetical protein
MAWSGRITAKAKGEHLNLGHERLSDAGGSIEYVLCPPDEHRRIRPTAPSRLDVAGAFCILSGDRKTAILK